MLPNFLNIGVARCGTSWLHNLLDSHPEVFVPKKRKEVHFFCNYYDRGLEWYKEFFPPDGEKEKYQAVGEVAVHYLLDHEKSAKRIADVEAIERLIVMLRDPVERAWSHYHWKLSTHESSKSIREKAKEAPMIIESGFYAEGLRSYNEHFDRSDILILKSNSSFSDVYRTKKRISDFLNIDIEKFPKKSGKKKVNENKKKRFGTIYDILSKLSYKMRTKDLDWLSNAVKKTGLKSIFVKDEKATKKNMSKKDLEWLTSIYEKEAKDLEREFGVNTSEWRKKWERRLK